jgi:transposase
MILELHQQGLSVSAIAERTGHDRKTARRAIGRGLVVLKYAARTPRPTLLGPCETCLRERVAASAWLGSPPTRRARRSLRRSGAPSAAPAPRRRCGA